LVLPVTQRWIIEEQSDLKTGIFFPCHSFCDTLSDTRITSKKEQQWFSRGGLVVVAVISVVSVALCSPPICPALELSH